jgi:hypothetical protein
VLREYGEMSWLPYQHVDLESAKARELVIVFERHCPRESKRPCNGVAFYDEVTDERYESSDEAPLALRREIVENLCGEFD